MRSTTATKSVCTENPSDMIQVILAYLSALKSHLGCEQCFRFVIDNGSNYLFGSRVAAISNSAIPN